MRRRDPLLQLAHLRRQRRLVADGARHAAEQRRHFGARLREAEDVVDEQQHVVALVAEVLRHRQAGQADAQPGARRLVHLAVHERDLVEHLRLLHLEQEVVALARALADAGEHGVTAVLTRDVVDQLLDQHRLAETGAAEEADLAAADERREQVDHLDARLEDLDLRRQLRELRRLAMDRPALDVRRRRLLVDRLADDVPDAPERLLAHRHGDRPTGIAHLEPAREPVGRVHRDGADAIVTEVLLHLRDQRALLLSVTGRDVDAEGGIDLRQALREDDVDRRRP